MICAGIGSEPFLDGLRVTGDEIQKVLDMYILALHEGLHQACRVLVQQPAQQVDQVRGWHRPILPRHFLKDLVHGAPDTSRRISGRCGSECRCEASK